MATKKKAYPKRPKISAPLSTWENYHAKVKEVDKYNADLLKDKKKKAALIAKKVGKR